MSEYPDGVALIAAERQRQVAVEGWTAEHDAGHDTGALAAAGAVYALTIACSEVGSDMKRVDLMLDFWPWWQANDPCLPAWWKPTPDDPIRQLVKAGALIAAEIDRLQRRAMGVE